MWTAPRRTTCRRPSREGDGAFPVVAGRSEEEQRPAAQRLWRGRHSLAGVQGDATGGRRYTYYPDTSEVPEASAARTLGSSFKILAEVEFTKASQGVIVSQGSRFGGYTMFVKDGQLYFVYNFLGIPPEQKLSCPAPTSGKHVVGVDFAKSSVSEKLEVLGTMTLYVDDGPLRPRISGHRAATILCAARAWPSDVTAPTPYRPSTPRDSTSPADRSSR